jgi:hypothetical protein
MIYIKGALCWRNWENNEKNNGRQLAVQWRFKFPKARYD